QLGAGGLDAARAGVLADHRGDHVGEQLLELGQRGAVRAVAHDEPVDLGVLVDGGHVGGQRRAGQLVLVGVQADRAVHARHQGLLDEPLHGRVDQVVLVGEVAVQDRLGHADLRGDLVHARRRAAGAHRGERAVDQLFTAVDLVLAPPALAAVHPAGAHGRRSIGAFTDVDKVFGGQDGLPRSFGRMVAWSAYSLWHSRMEDMEKAPGNLTAPVIAPPRPAPAVTPAAPTGFFVDETVKKRDLLKMKALATGLLALATAIYLCCRWLESRGGGGDWVGDVRAAAEAGMVGALADWFAVTALFRHPLGLPIPHTAIIRKKKDQLGASLGSFVGTNFLAPEVVSEKVRSAQVSLRVGRWMADPGHAERVAQESSTILRAVVGALRDEDVEQIIDNTIVKRIAEPLWGPPIGRV